MGIEPAHDLALVDIELAGMRNGLAGVELLLVGPLADGAHIQTQGARGLRRA